MKKIKKLIIIIASCLLIYQIVCLGVLYQYTNSNYNNSFLADNNIKLKFNTDLHVYPFMLVYDASKQFSNFINDDVNLIIYYNVNKNNIYDEDSSYFWGFYGAYIFQNKNKNLDIVDNNTELTNITNFDLSELVLKSVGDNKPYIDYQINSFSYITIGNINYKVIDCDLDIDSLNHQFKSFHQAYIQYGFPSINKVDSFNKVSLKAKMFMYYDKTTNINYLFYIIAKGDDELNLLEQRYMQNFVISN